MIPPECNVITVEPVQFLYGLMATVSAVVRDKLFIDKVCRLKFNYSEAVCSNLTAHPEIKNDVQEIVTDLEMLDGILVAIPSLIFAVFMGPWSDYRGRKPLLILPFIGNIISFLAYILNYYFFDELGIYHLLWGSAVGLSGGYICLNIGLYGYIADVSSPAKRTTRLSILNGVFSASYVAGNLIGGQLFAAIHNYYAIFGISIGVGILGILYTFIFIKETVQHSDEPQRRLFDIGHVRDCLKTAFKDRRPQYPRFGVLILILHFAAMMFCLNTSRYDFLLMINKFDWRVEDFSNFLIATRVCRFVGLFILLPFLSGFLKIEDEIISAGGTLVSVISYIIIALGKSSWLMFVAVVFQFNSIVTVAIRSQCTKAVTPEEIGKVFAVVALGQSIVPFISNPLYGLIYKNTLDVLPGAYLLTVSALLLIAFCGAGYLYIKRYRTEARPLNEE